MSEHGLCPNCGVDLDGGSIWETGAVWAAVIGLPDIEAEADRYASAYGATRSRGRWGREIGIYDWGKDRTVSWRCPDCDHEWPR